MKHIRIQTTDSRISDHAFHADDEVYFTTNRSVYFAKGKQLQKVYDYPPQHHSLCMNMHLPNKTYVFIFHDEVLPVFVSCVVGKPLLL